MGVLVVLTLFKTFIQCCVSVEKLFKIMKNSNTQKILATATLNRCRHLPCLVWLLTLLLVLYKQHSIDISKFSPSFSLLGRSHFAEIVVNFSMRPDAIGTHECIIPYLFKCDIKYVNVCPSFQTAVQYSTVLISCISPSISPLKDEV